MVEPIQICGDFVHLLAFMILIAKIWSNRSCAGISGKTQLLFATVLTLRYLDVFVAFNSLYLTIFKIVYILISYIIVYHIFVEFRESYDRSNDTFRSVFIVLPALILALFVNYISFNMDSFKGLDDLFRRYANNPIEILWTFSIYLEPLAIIPQYYMIRKTGDGQNVLSYIIALTLSRALYICHWIRRYVILDVFDHIYPPCGIVQFVLLIIIIINIQTLKKTKPKWQEITEVFTIEATKLGSPKKPETNYSEDSDWKQLL